MQGGSGDDTYVVDNVNDVFVELAGQGNDTVEIGMAITLGANIENAVLTGSGNIAAIGNEQDNRLNGNSGDNLLDGKSGKDFMAGGTGNDTYVTDTQNDTIVEGIKRVREGKVHISPGFDGEYGKIKIFNDDERMNFQKKLF